MNDYEKAKAEISKLKGPTATMLAAGIDHIEEPKDLVEEVMYEEMLTTRMSVNKFTPFLAVCASTAPLMGLLGTVTGIINTFKMITVFGSGDVKTLSRRYFRSLGDYGNGAGGRDQCLGHVCLPFP